MSEADMLDAEQIPDPPRGRQRGYRREFFKRFSDRTPLRTKLITSVLVLVIMALAAISVASVVVLRGYLYTQRDTQLSAQFNHIFGGLSGTSVTLDLPYNAGSGMILAFQNPGSQIQSADTGPAPPGMGNTPRPTQSLPRLSTAKDWAPTSSPVFFTVPAQSGGDTWRVIAQAITVTNSSGTQQTAVMLVGTDLGPIGAEVQRLITVELFVGTAIVIVLAVVAIGVVRTNLRPLNDIELTAGQIAQGHLDHRVPERDPRTEIGSLGRSLNTMLTQIERAFHAQGKAEQAAHQSEERMRRFVADAAHELRTPLTTIRGFAAHYRQRGGASRMRRAGTVENTVGGVESGDIVRDDRFGPSGSAQEGLSPADLDHLMGRVEAEATRMGLLVEDLLTLARLDQQRPLAKAPVDMLTIAADAVQDARIVSPGRPIDLVVAPGTAFLIDGDEPRLRQVLANLVNNAITHTPAGTPVRVKIGRGSLEAHASDGNRSARAPEQVAWGGAANGDGSRAAGREMPAIVIDVEDDGPGMTAEQAQRVFERFYRADAARNRASGGTGLGLAIVAGLVSAHDGTVSVRTAPGQGADFQVKLPLSPDALAADDADDDLPA
jgi:two-component system, OmpR family, sensor kinase